MGVMVDEGWICLVGKSETFFLERVLCVVLRWLCWEGSYKKRESLVDVQEICFISSIGVMLVEA